MKRGVMKMPLSVTWARSGSSCFATLRGQTGQSGAMSRRCDDGGPVVERSWKSGSGASVLDLQGSIESAEALQAQDRPRSGEYATRRAARPGGSESPAALTLAEFVGLCDEKVEIQQRAAIEIVGGVAGVDEVGVEPAPDQVVVAGGAA